MPTLPFDSAYLPPEYGQKMFEDVTAYDEQAQAEQMRQFIEGINAIGKTYTGSALRSAISRVLGPASNRQRDIISRIAIQGAETGAAERQGIDQWGRQVAEADRGRSFTAAEAEKQRAFLASQNEADRAEKRRTARGARPSFASTMLNSAMGVAGNMATGGLTSMIGGLPSLLGVANPPTGSPSNDESLPSLGNYPEDNYVMKNRKPKPWWEY